jgi:hypothetical protein
MYKYPLAVIKLVDEKMKGMDCVKKKVRKLQAYFEGKIKKFVLAEKTYRHSPRVNRLDLYKIGYVL